jgi:hypothetical protein
MENTLKLSNAKLPRLVGELTHSIEFLKLFAMITSLLLGLSLLAVCLLSMKKPSVITLSENGTQLQQTSLPSPTIEVEAAIKEYFRRRYNWDPKTVDQSLSAAESFVTPASLKAFREGLATVSRFSKEKAVTQRAYPREILVGLDGGTVKIRGDRISAIQGYYAAAELKLELTFENGRRTKENPWGVYIVKEREEELSGRVN